MAAPYAAFQVLIMSVPLVVVVGMALLVVPSEGCFKDTSSTVGAAVGSRSDINWRAASFTASSAVEVSILSIVNKP